MNCKSSTHSSLSNVQELSYSPHSKQCVRKKKGNRNTAVKEKTDTKRHQKGIAGLHGQLEMGCGGGGGGGEGKEGIKRGSEVSSLGDREHVSALRRNKKPRGNPAPRKT